MDKKDEQNKKAGRRPLISKLIIVFLFFALIYLYARYVGTQGLVVREYNIINENIPSSFDGFSIVHFSDIELGTTFFLEDLDLLVEKINAANPDIVVFTGDIVSLDKYDISDEEVNELGNILSKIDPLIGKYAIKGDDDYSGIYDEVMRSSGFKDISNSYELIYYKGLTPIVLYGLGSLLMEDQDYSTTFSYPSLEEDATYMATYRVLLAHEPDTANYIKDYNISLMLSGHSHNSELNIPYLKEHFGIAGASDYYDSEYQIGGMSLYISSGLGTSKYKVRLFSKPSFSIYRLYTD